MLVAQLDWNSPYRPRAVRIHIVRRTGAPDAGHPFRDHPWCAIDSDRGIAWGVLGAPSIEKLLGVVRGQRVEEEIRCPRYLIGATGEGSARLRRAPEQPLPLRQLIFLNRDDDIRAWLLANDGRDPLDLMVLESRPDQGEDGVQTPEPANGRYPFFNRKVWDHPRQVEDTVGAMQEEEEGEEEEEEEAEAEEEEEDGVWFEGESLERSVAPCRAGVFAVVDDDVSS